MNNVLLILLIIAGSFVLLLLLASYLKFEIVLRKAEGTATPDLSPRDRFLLRTFGRCGPTARRNDPFVLYVFELDSLPEGTVSDPADPAIPPLSERLKPLFRAGDELFDMGSGRWAALLGMEGKQAEQVLTRVFDRIRRDPEPGPLSRLRAGGAAYPNDGMTGDILLGIAEKALARAKSSDSPWALAPVPRAFAGDSEPAPEEGPSPDEARLVDPLTGVLRPDRVIAAVRKLVAKWRQRGRPVSALYLDVENLDLINTRFGRDAGDATLRVVGRILNRHVREADLIGRLKDDDFLIILEATPAQAEAAGKRLIELLRMETIQTPTTSLHPSVRMGCAGYPDFQGTPGELLEATEVALLYARQSGHNLCVRYSPELRKSIRLLKPPADRL
ncbi:MAG: diguanylate cyclase [Kiritimatiellia bacterium]|nr:diguanylate cyclase [Kiritimatiellia bacterium]